MTVVLSSIIYSNVFEKKNNYDRAQIVRDVYLEYHFLARDETIVLYTERVSEATIKKLLPKPIDDIAS